jgi:PiT family inorganic phosphate transporter
MVHGATLSFWIFICFAMIFQLLMGANDGGVLLGSIISSNFIHPLVAVIILFLSLFSAPFIFGTAVVKTLGTKIFPTQNMTLAMLYGALLATMTWVIIAQKIKYPVSISYTFVGTLVGSALATKYAHQLNATEVYKVFGGLLASILISFVLGYIFLKITNLLLMRAKPRISIIFRILQIFTSILLVLGYGSNDAEKTLSLIYMAAIITHSHISPNAKDPLIVLGLATVFIIGTMLFGGNSATTSGFRIMKSKPKQVFLTQFITSFTVLYFAKIGLPISSTETLNMGLVGIGSAEKPYSVKWNVVKNLVLTWIITIPMSILISFAYTFILGKIL